MIVFNRLFLLTLLLAGFAGVTLQARASDVPIALTGGPYVPTPQRVVDEMLKLAGVGKADTVVDLGSGDGRIVLTAAQTFGARGRGYDLEPELVERSNAAAAKLGLQQRVRFHQQDVLKADLAGATVVTLYLLPEMMHQLRAKLLRELKPGTRIVSHDFDFGDWKPARSVNVELDIKYDIPGSWSSVVHLWIVPEQAAR